MVETIAFNVTSTVAIPNTDFLNREAQDACAGLPVYWGEHDHYRSKMVRSDMGHPGMYISIFISNAIHQ